MNHPIAADLASTTALGSGANTAEPRVQTDVNLQPFNTLAVPVRAKWFAVVTSAEQLLWLLKSYPHTPKLILGGGSNIVLTDDFDGLVIQLRIMGIETHADPSDYRTLIVRVGAGVNWNALVQYSVNAGLYGLENLSGIPGSVGAAPIQNIGAYGVEVCDHLVSVEGIDSTTGDSFNWEAARLKLGYRHSIFKEPEGCGKIITHVTLRLTKQFQANLSYPVLHQALERKAQQEQYHLNDITAQSVAQEVLSIRRSKLPNPDVIPNVGSFFKNPILSADTYQSLLQRFPDLVAFPQGAQYKIPAAWLIDHCGWKGRTFETAGVHEKQALVITNPQRGSGKAILNLAKRIQQSVKATFGVDLQIEPTVV